MSGKEGATLLIIMALFGSLLITIHFAFTKPRTERQNLLYTDECHSLNGRVTYDKFMNFSGCIEREKDYGRQIDN